MSSRLRIRAVTSAIAAISAVAGLALGALPAAAMLVGGKVEHRPGDDPAGEIAGAGRTPETVWFAWSVPARGSQGAGTICGYGSGGSSWGMTLDGVDSSWGSRDGAPVIATSKVEFYVAVREGRIRRLRFASEGCPVQAGVQRVVWLDGVTPAASVAFLARLAEWTSSALSDGPKGEDEVGKSALAGLAFHADPGAPLALVHLGRESAEEEVRAQAQFWLAQSADPRAARWIREAIARDPSSEVREQSVFALSQVADATPQLLALLRESSDRAVKRQAIFWLGQSDDPQAIAEIERLLTR